MLVSDILGNVYENGTFTGMARVEKWDGSLLTQSTTTSIHYTIYNTADNSIPSGHNNVSLTVSDCVYNTLQTNAIWSADDTGYNFAFTPDVSSNNAFTGVGNVYLVVATIQPTTGQAIIVRWRVNVI